MTTVVPAFIERSTSDATHTFNAPSGIDGLSGLIAIGTGFSTAVTITASASGATFTKLDERQAGTTRATLFKVTGLPSGTLVTLTLSGGNNTVGVDQLYTDEYTVPDSISTPGTRSSSDNTTTSGAYTPAVGQRVLVVAIERTTSATTVTDISSTGGETVTTDRYGEGATIQTSVLIAHFDAASASSHTVTITYSNSSANGYAALVPLTAVAPPPGGGASPPVIRSSSNVSAPTVSTTVDCPAPAGIQVDDYLIAIQGGDADNALASMTAAAFSTVLATATGSGGSNIPFVKVWGKVATSGDAGASVFTFGDAASSDHAVIMLAIQAGTYNTATPVQTPVAAFTLTARTSTTLETAPSVTAIVNQLLLAIFDADINDNPSSAPFQDYPSSGPTGMTKVASVRAGGNYLLVGVYSQAITSAGATGTKTVTPDNAGSQNGWAAGSMLVNPNPSTTDATKFFMTQEA